MKRRWKILLGLLLFGLLMALLAFLGFEIATRIAASSLPEVVDNGTYRETIWQITRVYGQDEVLLDEFSRDRRTVVSLERISPHLVHAVIAAEDHSFYMHSGVDWKAIARAAIWDILHRKFVQGGSTITQQLARNLYLSHEKTLWRKFKEAVLARKLEEKLSKDDILFQYLNTIYWGHGRYGAQEAARLYFAKQAAELGPAESALMAGIVRGPELLSPLKFPEKARERMEQVVGNMIELGFLDGTVSDYTYPVVVRGSAPHLNVAPYAVDAALVEIKRRLDPNPDIETAGLSIYTTIDVPVQRRMNRAVERYLHKLRPRIKTRRDGHLDPGNCVLAGRLRPGCPVWARVVEVDPAGQHYLAEILGRLGRITADTLTAVAKYRPGGDVLKKDEWVKVIPHGEVMLTSPWLTEEIHLQPLVEPQIAAVLMNAGSGAVVALYGGVDHRYHPYNRAISAHRQIGSTIKPFLYLAASELLDWDVDTSAPAGALDLPGAKGKRWSIRDSHPLEADATIVQALAHSSNTSAVRTLQAVGLENFRAQWSHWGLPEFDTKDLSVALGNVSMSPLELAQCYALLANSGRCAPEPTLIVDVTDGEGHKLAHWPRFCLGSADSEAVATVMEGLFAVVEKGTGTRARLPYIAVAGKTGTTTGGRDAWFAGIVDEYVLVVWVGTDDHEEMPGNAGPTSAAVLWQEIASECFSKN